MRELIVVILAAACLASAGTATAQKNEQIPVIFDTDFVMPPADDSMALMLALQSPEFEILGITTVAGNDSLERTTSDLLRMLEIARQDTNPPPRYHSMAAVLADLPVRMSTIEEWVLLNNNAFL